MNAKTRITTSAPHNRVDRISSQIALVSVGSTGWVGRVGGGSGADLFMNGGALPNRRKGRLNSNKTSARINCARKARMPVRKPTRVPNTEKRPRLSPAGSRLTATAKINKNDRL